jgi:hypothetical protein
MSNPEAIVRPGIGKSYSKKYRMRATLMTTAARASRLPPRNPQRKTAGAARSRGSRCFIPNTQAARG